MRYPPGTIASALALSLVIAHTVQANASDGSKCLNVVAAESLCSPNKYQAYLDDMAETPENFSQSSPNYFARLGDRERYSIIVGQWRKGITDLDLVIKAIRKIIITINGEVGHISC